MLQKVIFIISIILFIHSNDTISQESHSFLFETDSLVLDGISLKPKNVSGSIKVGEPTYFDLLNLDSISIRLKVILIKKGSKSNKLKIRIDIMENGRWYKPPVFIDIHHFTRFRIRMEQCWMRNRYWGGGLDGFLIDMNCNCSKPFKAKTKHQFNFIAQVKVD